MMQIFGLTFPTSSLQADGETVMVLAGQIATAVAALREGAPAALSVSVRRDTRRYLDARRRGELRLPNTPTARACDEGALSLMRLTVNAPPVLALPERLVA